MRFGRFPSRSGRSGFDKEPAGSFPLFGYALIAAISWNAIVVGSLVWSGVNSGRQTRQLAEMSARTHLPDADELLQSYLDLEQTTRAGLAVSHGIIWAIGLAALGFAVCSSRRAIAEQSQIRASALQSSRLIALGEMASGVAHELNQPLTVLSLLAERSLLRLERGEEMTGGEQGEWAREIVGNIDRMTNIIDHMRQFSRDHSHEPRAEVSLNEVVHSVLNLTSAQLKSWGVELKLELATGLPRVCADSYRLEEVVQNLILNARDALEKEGIALTAGGDLKWNKILTIRTRTEGVPDEEWVMVEVVDTGTGISEEDQARLFQPFFTTKGPDKGTGLGLALSYAIVREHGGRLECESEIGDGACFRVSLPAARVATGPGQGEPDRARKSRSR